MVDGMLRGRFTYRLSLDLLAEYGEVLLRPRISRRHGLGDAGVDAILTEVALNGIVRDPPPLTRAVPDAGDRHLWALLEAARPAPRYGFAAASPVTVASVLCANRIPHTPSVDVSFPAATNSDLG